MSEVQNLSETNSRSTDLTKLLKQHLESLRRSGVTELPKGTGRYSFEFESGGQGLDEERAQAAGTIETTKAAAPSTDRDSSQPADQPPSKTAASSQASLVGLSDYPDSLGVAQRRSALQVVQDEVAACTRCSELASARTNTVFGVGNPTSRLVFVGEGPGYHEDQSGEPFVGEAGQLLDKILAACKLTRNDVYILNTVKCRPPANRNPATDELANCWGYAERQLEIIQPEMICCLGSVAARTVLKTTQPLGKLRGQFHAYRGSRVVVTYHPAYLLRTPSAKKHVWKDMKMLMKELGVDLTS